MSCRLESPDLLGRWEMGVVREATRLVVEGRRVLVTGAGGSVGTELCRQGRGFGPRALLALDHDGSNLHRMQLELDGCALLESDELIVADVRDAARIRQLFREARPEIVFHAAGHAHLPLLERHPCEAAKSNVAATMPRLVATLDAGGEPPSRVWADKSADPPSFHD